MRPMLAAAREAGREYERRPAGARWPEPVLDDCTACGNPSTVCALTRPHLRREPDAGRERELLRNEIQAALCPGTNETGFQAEAECQLDLAAE